MHIDFANPCQPNSVEAFDWNDTELYVARRRVRRSTTASPCAAAWRRTKPRPTSRRAPRACPTTTACCTRSAAPGTSREAFELNAAYQRIEIDDPRVDIDSPAARTWSASSTVTPTCSAFRRSTSSESNAFIAVTKKPRVRRGFFLVVHYFGLDWKTVKADRQRRTCGRTLGPVDLERGDEAGDGRVRDPEGPSLRDGGDRPDDASGCCGSGGGRSREDVRPFFELLGPDGASGSRRWRWT